MVTLDMTDKDRSVAVKEDLFSTETGILTLQISLGTYDLTGKTVTAVFSETGVETGVLTVTAGIIQLPIVAGYVERGTNNIQLNIRLGLTLEQSPIMVWQILEPVSATDPADSDVDVITWLLNSAIDSKNAADAVVASFEEDLGEGHELQADLQASIATGTPLLSDLQDANSTAGGLLTSLTTPTTGAIDVATAINTTLTNTTTPAAVSINDLLDTPVTGAIARATAQQGTLEQAIATGQEVDANIKESIALGNIESIAKNSNWLLQVPIIPAFDGTGDVEAAAVTSADIYALYDNLATSYPDYITKTLLGNDQSNTLPIYKYVFEPAYYSNTIILDAGIHGGGSGGDPKDNVVALYYAMKTICENWENDNKLSMLRHNTRIVVIPIVNPWGVDHDSRYNSQSVDINRNFDWKWSGYVDVHKGSTAFSEKESQYLRDVLLSYQTARGYISFHVNDGSSTFHYTFISADNSVLYPLGKDLLGRLMVKNEVVEDAVIGLGNTQPMSRGYAESVLFIPSIMPEYVANTADSTPRTSENATRMVEWYLNWIYQPLVANKPLLLEKYTFTPYVYGSSVAGSNTYTDQKGFYTIDKNRVYFEIEIVMSSKDGAMSGNVYVGGLPFASDAHGFPVIIGKLTYASYGTAKQLHAMVGAAAKYIYLYKINDNADRGFLTAADIGNSFSITLSGNYTI